MRKKTGTSHKFLIWVGIFMFLIILSSTDYSNNSISYDDCNDDCYDGWILKYPERYIDVNGSLIDGAVVCYNICKRYQ